MVPAMKLFAALSAFFAISLSPAPAIAAWPNGARAAVVLTYDDAAPSQLDHAVPALDKLGLKGTFFLSNVRIEDVERWRRAARGGHELANHTLFHPCLSSSFDMPSQQQLEQHTPQSVLREIAQQNVLLTAIDGRGDHGFAVPCGQTMAGGTDYLPALRQSGLVTYSRSIEQTDRDLARNPGDFDPFALPGKIFSGAGQADAMIAYADRAMKAGGMAVFVFHGVGGDHLSVSADDHARLAKWLADRRGSIWVATMRDVAKWINAEKDRSPRSR